MQSGLVSDVNMDWNDRAMFPLYLEMDFYETPKMNALAKLTRRWVVVGRPSDKRRHGFVDIGEVPVFSPEDNKSIGFDPFVIEISRKARFLEKHEILQMKLEYNL